MQLSLYSRFMAECREAYGRWPEFYHELIYGILAEVERYADRTFTAIIDNTLSVPAISEPPDIIRISPTTLVMDNSVVAFVIAHEVGHHVNNNLHRTESLEQSEYQADLYSIGFLKAYRYDLSLARNYRIDFLDLCGQPELIFPVREAFDREIRRPIMNRR